MTPLSGATEEHRVGADTTAATVPADLHGREALVTPFPYHRRLALNAVVLSLGYCLALIIALVVAGLLRQWLLGDPMVPVWSLCCLPIWIAGAMLMRLLPGWGLGSVEEMRRTVVLWGLLIGGTSAALFFLKSGPVYSRFTFAVAFVISLPLLLLVRTQMKRILIRFNQWGLPTVVYGAARTGTMIVEAMNSEKGLGFTPVGFFDDDANLKNRKVAGLPVLGNCREATTAAPVAIIAMPGVRSSKIVELLEAPLAVYPKVIIIPDLFEAPSLWVKPRDFLGILGLEITSNLLNPLPRFLKRTADLGVTLATAPVWIPLGVLIAAVIWIRDRRHPFFVQERIGRDGKPFRMFKFRTMMVDADVWLKERLDADPQFRKQWESDFKLADDPRVTRLGAFLRRTSLDELPQLLNVLRGEISLVGPRPLPDYHYRELPERVRRFRDRVLPGITGLWQVSGRSDLGSEGMERWDPYYVRNWSIWLDIVILARTLRAVWTGGGAY